MIFFALAFSAILFIATKILLRYLDDEVVRRSSLKSKSGDADLD